MLLPTRPRAIVLLSTFMISHFELFGLTQAWRRLRNLPTPPSGFKVVLLYRFVRHPIMLGFIIAFWAAPVMTQGHLIDTWRDARIFGAVAGLAFYAWQRSLFYTIVCGTGVMLALRFGLGW